MGAAAELAQSERAELCELFVKLGPDAPTLCEGWRARELAAHLFIRESRPHKALGIASKRFESLTGKAMESALERYGFEGVVDRVRSGPPLLLRPLDGKMNLLEFTIHHEDLRRPNGMGPREDIDDLEAAVWKGLRQFTRLMSRRAGELAITLSPPEATHLRVGRGVRPVEVRGSVVDLAMYCFGRGAAAELDYVGDPETVEAAKHAPFGG